MCDAARSSFYVLSIFLKIVQIYKKKPLDNNNYKTHQKQTLTAIKTKNWNNSGNRNEKKCENNHK